MTTDFAKANILGSYFSEQCTNPMPEHNYVGAPFPLPQHHPSFTFPEISELSVFRKLQRLSPFKSTGNMFITNQLLRETAPVISTSLAYLYDLSLKTTVFPSQWKSAKVTPIFKNRGDPSNPSNYRPVSLALPSYCQLYRCHWQGIRCPTKPISIGVFTTQPSDQRPSIWLSTWKINNFITRFPCP